MKLFGKTVIYAEVLKVTEMLSNPATTYGDETQDSTTTREQARVDRENDQLRDNGLTSGEASARTVEQENQGESDGNIAGCAEDVDRARDVEDLGKLRKEVKLHTAVWDGSLSRAKTQK